MGKRKHRIDPPSITECKWLLTTPPPQVYTDATLRIRLRQLWQRFHPNVIRHFGKRHNAYPLGYLAWDDLCERALPREKRQALEARDRRTVAQRASV